MSRFRFADGGADVMGSSNTIFRPVDHRRPGVPSDGTGFPIQHDHRSGRAGRASCSRYRTGPVQHSCRVEDVKCRFQCAGRHGAGLRRAPIVQSSSGRAGHSSSRKSATLCQVGTRQRRGEDIARQVARQFSLELFGSYAILVPCVTGDWSCSLRPHAGAWWSSASDRFATPSIPKPDRDRLR